MGKKGLHWLGCLGICLLLCGAMPAAAAETTIVTGKVMSTVARARPMPFNAVVDEVLVKPGDAVEEGQPLLRYHLQEEAGRILQREVTSGAGTEGQKAQVLELQTRLSHLIAERNKARQLAATGLGSRQALARVEEEVKALQSRIDLLRATISKSESIFKARLKELEGYYQQKIKEGSELPRDLVLKAPIGGHVLSVDTALNPGALLSSGHAPIQVGQLDPVLIQVPVYEAEVGGIKEGDIANVEIPSLENRIFPGTVSGISWRSTDMNVATPSYYTVTLTVPNPGLELKPGFKAVVKFKSHS